MIGKGCTGQMSYSLMFKSVLCGAAIFLSSSALASVEVTNAYVRATIPGTQVSSAYMELHNKAAEGIKLVAAKSEISDQVEIHQHLMEGGMMKMRQVESLSIAANSSTVLQPSGYHLMIFNLKAPLKDGEKVKLTLVFDNETEKLITVPITSIKRKKAKHHH